MWPRELEKQVASMEKQRLGHMEHQQKMTAKCEKVKEAQRQSLGELDGYKAQLMAAQSKQERLLKELQMTKEKEAIFMDQRSNEHTQKGQIFVWIWLKVMLWSIKMVLDYRGLLDINMEQIVAECKSLRDKLARDTRVKDRLVRVLKRNELQLTQANDSLIHTQQQHARTQAQVTHNIHNTILKSTSRTCTVMLWIWVKP